MMLTKLGQSKNKVVGKKETLKAIKAGKTDIVFLAKDVDKDIINEILSVISDDNVSIVTVENKLKLGRACGIDVSAACAAILN